MSSFYNLKSPAVKRLMREAEELRIPTDEYYAQPLEDNLFEWHFTVRGPPKTDFDGGIYHGRISLPADYPMKPPSIILLTPNGRFEINKKICLSISGHHPESWQPSWSIRTALLAIIGFMPTHGNGAIGSLDYSSEERQALAQKSQKWCCTECGSVENLLGNAVFDSSVENEAERQNLFDVKRQTVGEESSSQETTITQIQQMDIRPQFSFAPGVDSMLEALQHPESSHLAHRLSSDHARQRMFSQENNQENANPIFVENLTHVWTRERLFVTICTVCIYIIALLLCILLIRRIFFYH